MMGRGCSVEWQKLKGIVPKHRSSPYRSGDCRDWVKTQDDGLARVQRCAMALV